MVTWWSLVSWAARAHFAAFGVGVMIAAWERHINGGNWILNGGLSYLLAVSWFTIAYSLLSMREPAKTEPAAPIYLPPAPRPLPRLEDTQPIHPRYEAEAPRITDEWDWLSFQPSMVTNLKACLRSYGRFSWRTRPARMNEAQYKRTRLFLLKQGWGYEYRGAVNLTDAGKAAVGIPSPAARGDD